MFEPEPNDPSIPELATALAQAEAAMKADDAGQQQADPAKEPDSATTEAPARPQGEGEPVDSTISKESGDTPPDLQKKTEPQKPETQPAKPGEESKYRQNQTRLEGGWKKLNENKSEFAKAQESFKKQQEDFAKRVRDFESKQQQTSAKQFKPEDYESAAKKWQAEAEELEAAGEFEKADQQRAYARKALEQAKHLRDNPPPPPKTDAQAEADFETLRKEWWTKAAQDYPESQKPDSPLAMRLKAVLTPGAPDYDKVIADAVNSDPQAMYYVTRLMDAEVRAESVPALNKELDELRAKVKDLTEKTSIPGGGIATTISKPKADAEKSTDELEEELRHTAEQMGSLR